MNQHDRSRLRRFLEGRALWIGFLAAFLPLVVLLALQYVWLNRLEEAASLAGRAVLSNLLEGVTTEILYTYGPAAERAPDLPAAILTENQPDRAAAHFRRRSHEGVRTFFTVRFSHAGGDSLLVYDPRAETMRTPAPSDETRAITVACAPWKLMNDSSVEVDEAGLVVEERDPRNRIILIPVLGAGSRVIGVAGMVLEAEDFLKRVLPGAVDGTLARSLGDQPRDRYVVTARDDAGRLVYSSAAAGRMDEGRNRDRAEDMSRPFTFVFTDWKIGIRRVGASPERWARAGFALDLTLSLLAAALLVGGLALALRTASREMRLSRMKSDFVANVSHELRTPLASIRVFGELLRLGRAASSEKVREYGEAIEAESRRLTQLVENILDFARIEAGQKKYNFVRCNLRELVMETVAAFQGRARSGGFAIEVDMPGESPLEANADPEAMRQVLHNLLDNAMKYSGSSRWIGVRAAQRGSEVAIDVEDRGIGISKPEQGRIFERFHRVSTGLVHDVRGSGLGLSIVQHVVRAHGGRVAVESAPGRGSLFTVYLPSEAPGALGTRSGQDALAAEAEGAASDEARSKEGSAGEKPCNTGQSMQDVPPETELTAARNAEEGAGGKEPPGARMPENAAWGKASTESRAGDEGKT